MLRCVTSTLTACVFAGTVSVLAQAQAPTAQPEQQRQQPPKETLTGCVIEAKTTDGGKAYVLNNAEGGTAKLYVLGASPTPDVEKNTAVDSNVNKKVEVTGPVLQPPPPADSAAAADPKVLRPPTVQVESVKVVAENCR